MTKGKLITASISAFVVCMAFVAIVSTHREDEGVLGPDKAKASRMRELVARLANVRSREVSLGPHMVLYRSKKDETVVDEIRAKGKAIVPYLIEGLDNKDDTIRWQCSRMLASVVPSKAGLMALIGKLEAQPARPARNSLDRGFLRGVSRDLELLTGQLCPVHLGLVDYSADEYGRMRTFWLTWSKQNGPSIVDVDYGIGLRQSDGTIRPLGFHGKITWYERDGETVRREGWYFCSHSRSETISEAEYMRRHQAGLGQKDWFPLVPHVGYEWRWNHVRLFERFYKDGKPHGRWREWDKEGQLTKEKHYVDGAEVTREQYEEASAASDRRRDGPRALPPSRRRWSRAGNRTMKHRRRYQDARFFPDVYARACELTGEKRYLDWAKETWDHGSKRGCQATGESCGRDEVWRFAWVRECVGAGVRGCGGARTTACSPRHSCSTACPGPSRGASSTEGGCPCCAESLRG